MIRCMKEEYESLKGYGNILVPYNKILVYYPDYYKVLKMLESEQFVFKEKIDKEFDNNYKYSGLYNKLVELAMDENEIYEFMKYNKDFKYNYLKKLFDKLRDDCINLCNLIDYIGHYPDTYPEAKDEEKNMDMEKLLEEYDIIVRYYFNDEIDDMQITSDDVVRIIDKLEKELELINSLKVMISTNDWIFRRKNSDTKLKEQVESAINEIDSFPLSNYQIKGKSKVEEGRMYLMHLKKISKI